MKEINFLPEWYKSGRRRQFSYRTQYIALGGILLVMTVWHFLNLHSISRVQAQIKGNAVELKQAEDTSARLAGLQGNISLLNKKQVLIQKTDSRINLAGVLAEMSYLIGDKIVIGKVEINAERFEQQDKGNTEQVAAVVRAAQYDSVKTQTLTGDVRFKIIISGVAADAADVAALMCKLEESPYFSSVVLSYSRNARLQTQSGSSISLQTVSDTSDAGKNSEQKTSLDIPVSRFEISSYLANYRQI